MAVWRSLAAAAMIVAAVPAWAQTAPNSAFPAPQAASQAAPQPQAGAFYLGVTPGWARPAEKTGMVAGRQVSLDYEDGGSIALAAGVSLPRGFRVEGEVGYIGSGIDSITVDGVTSPAEGDATILSGAVNGFYEINTRSPFRPYAGGGFGLAHIRTGSLSAGGVTVDKQSDTDIMLQGEVGLAVKVTPKFIVMPSYRYSHVFDGEHGFDDTEVHNLRLGARAEF